MDGTGGMNAQGLTYHPSTDRLTVQRPGIELMTVESQVRRSNHLGLNLQNILGQT